jgi:Calcineurin-like phosphoesterase
MERVSYLHNNKLQIMTLVSLQQVIGGCDKRAQSTAKDMQNKTPDLIIALGDLSYQKHASCWLKIMSPLLNRTVIAIGDHEFHFKNSTRLEEYMKVFHMKNQYYSFDLENVHFLAMSAEIPFDKK